MAKMKTKFLECSFYSLESPKNSSIIVSLRLFLIVETEIKEAIIYLCEYSKSISISSSSDIKFFLSEMVICYTVDDSSFTKKKLIRVP